MSYQFLLLPIISCDFLSTPQVVNLLEGRGCKNDFSFIQSDCGKSLFEMCGCHGHTCKAHLDFWSFKAEAASKRKAADNKFADDEHLEQAADDKSQKEADRSLYIQIVFYILRL